jgi:type IV secretion system protein VirB10
MIVAHELGLVGQLECVRSVAAATTPHLDLMKDNPLSKIPALVLNDGTPLYDSRVIYGQSRVLIAWNRIIFPDGSAVTLGAMPGADMSGYAGFTDQVNNHYLRIFGSAVLMSLITGGTSYAVDSVSNNSNSTAQSTTVQDAMASSLASQLGQTTQMLLQRNLNIKPTLEIRPGYQFNVIVTKDVVFKGAYR